MCGIAGILDRFSPVSEQDLIRFTDTLAHRGPDGREVFIDGRIGLGHRRLAVLNPAGQNRGVLAYGGADGRRYRITFDGRIHNFLEVRRKLEELGDVFHTETDAEIVVAAYARWGENCSMHFNGMWAFAVWDSVDQTLFLSRDRFGIKPLYFLADEKRICFASELKAFTELNGFSPALNPEVARLSLTDAAVCEGTVSDTLMRGIRRLMPGHTLTIPASGQIALRRWWDTRAYPLGVPSEYPGQVTAFQNMLVDAIRLCLRSDTAIGTAFSGGIASGTIASVMAWLDRQGIETEGAASDRMRSFTAVFPGTPIDEREFADRLAAHAGMKRCDVVIRPDQEAMEPLLRCLWAADEIQPYSPLPAWQLYRGVREQGVATLLGGYGSDELLGGYTRYLDVPMNQINDHLYRDIHQTSLPTLLRLSDRCAMAHGVELRMPLLDWRLVCLVTALDAETKLGDGYTKRLLRDAMIGTLPDPLRLRRSRVAFTSPTPGWYNDTLRTLLRSAASHPLWRDSPLWNGPEFRDRVLARLDSAPWAVTEWEAAPVLWSMANLVIWQLLFIEKRTPGPAFFN